MSEDKKKHVDDDYDFSRDQYYKLVEKGEEAIELMMDFARESESPRAFEVLSAMIKTNAEIADRLMDLQKKKKDVLSEPKSGVQQPALTGVTNNNLFIGSTKDLAKLVTDRQEVMTRNIIDNESSIND
jgi:dTDP-D-glucose 4,6-dehydratase